MEGCAACSDLVATSIHSGVHLPWVPQSRCNLLLGDGVMQMAFCGDCLPHPNSAAASAAEGNDPGDKEPEDGMQDDEPDADGDDEPGDKPDDKSSRLQEMD